MKTLDRRTPTPRASEDDMIAPPNSMQVEAERKVVLFNARGVPLTREIGFQAPAPPRSR